MYLTLQKSDYLPNFQVPISAPLDNEDRISFAFDQLNLINGDYKLTLIGHSGSGQTKTWSLGNIKVWFKEGSSEITNNQLQAEYFPLKEVTASYPPPDNQGNPIISFAIVGLIGVLVLMYIRRQI